MINRLFLALAKRLRPELTAMSGLELIGSLIDLVALAYLFPFATTGLVWLLASTDLNLVRQEWMVFVLMLVVGWVFRQLDFTLRLEIRPGTFMLASGSFEMLIFWSAALLFGPTVLWTAVIMAILNFEWWRRSGRYPRWYRWRELFTDIANTTLAGLLALTVYAQLGGEIPVANIGIASIGPVIIATLVWFLIPRLLVLPLLLYASRSPDLVGKESLTDQSTMTRFLLLGASISGIADPFAVLAAVLYAEQGVFVYLAFLGAAFLAALLANRLSHAVAHSEQRAREMATLEQFSRAIMTAPAEKSSLPDILAEHMEGMFPNSHMEVRLFPDELLYQKNPEGFSVDESVWQRLRMGVEDHHLLPANFPSKSGERLVWDGMAVPIPKAEEEEPVGGIYLMTQPHIGNLIDFLPAAQSLAAQIRSVLQRIDLHEQALEEQAEVYQREVYAQAYQAEVYAQALALEKMTQELVIAGQIQASFLPEHLPDVPGWQMAVALEPAREASGDFYDFIELPNGRLGLVIADVAEKGMGAALYMALSRTLIRTYALEYVTAPEKVLAAANTRILADTNSDLFVTVFYAILDPQTGMMTYCNAGHNPPYLLQKQNGNKPQALTRTALPLGILEDTDWDQSAVHLHPGDVLTLYTDGVTEAQDEEDDFFGEKRLQEILQANTERSADVIEDKVITAVYDFAGDAPQFDDITLMVVVRES